MKRTRNRQEYNFSLRVKEKLEKAGFTVMMVPQSKYRRQIIDMLVIKGCLVLPMEVKGKQSKYLKEHNARQLKMQKEFFWKAGTPFCRVTQGKPGQIRFEVFLPPSSLPSYGERFIDDVRKALKFCAVMYAGGGV